MIYHAVANIIFFLHVCSTAFVVFGWVFDDQTVLVAHIGATLVIVTHWQFLQGRCCLTILEKKLREKSGRPYLAGKEEMDFIQTLLLKFLKLKISQNTSTVMQYTVIFCSVCMSGWKIALLLSL